MSKYVNPQCPLCKKIIPAEAKHIILKIEGEDTRIHWHHCKEMAQMYLNETMQAHKQDVKESRPKKKSPIKRKIA